MRLSTGMEVAEMLIKSGADVNFPREDGETPIHMAARGGNVKTFKILLEEGGDVRQTAFVSLLILIVSYFFVKCLIY